MTMAAAIENGTADTQAWSKPGRIASVDIVRRPRRRRRRSGAAWKTRNHPARRISASISSAPGSDNVGEREGLTPFIVIAYDAERRPLMLLPLALRHVYGARCASFMGGKHSTFNMALWDTDFAATATQADLEG